MYKSASSELSATAQARDHRLKANLRAALIGEEGLAGLTLSPDVVMERGYVIGRVETSDQAEAVRRVAHGVSGLRSIDVYLPISQSQPTADSNTISDMTTHTEIATALRLAPGVVASRINVTVLDSRAVLLGVVSGDEERHQVVRSRFRRQRCEGCDELAFAAGTRLYGGAAEIKMQTPARVLCDIERVSPVQRRLLISELRRMVQIRLCEIPRKRRLLWKVRCSTIVFNLPSLQPSITFSPN